MPQNPRQQVKQSIQSAINELQKAADKLTLVGHQYEEHHPEYYDAFCEIVAGCLQLKDACETLSDNI